MRDEDLDAWVKKAQMLDDSAINHIASSVSFDETCEDIIMTKNGQTKKPTIGQRPAFWLGSAAALAFAVVGIGLIYNNSGDTPIEAANQSDTSKVTESSEESSDSETTLRSKSDVQSLGAMKFQDSGVSLEADSIKIEANGKTFSPPLATITKSTPPIDDYEEGDEGITTLDGDQGDNVYKSLELTWFEQDAEMRLFLYLESDGEKWWVNEVRTYDGIYPAERPDSASSDQLAAYGNIFEAEIGAYAEGDFEVPLVYSDNEPGDKATPVGTLSITGLKLAAPGFTPWAELSTDE